MMQRYFAFYESVSIGCKRITRLGNIRDATENGRGGRWMFGSEERCGKGTVLGYLTHLSIRKVSVRRYL